MFALLIILTVSVTIEGQECVPCPEMCTCTTYRNGDLDCSGLELTSVLPGCGSNGTIEKVDFSDNNITVVDWGKVPLLDGSFCEINLRNNMISKSVGTISAQKCTFFYVFISNNSLNKVPTDFVVFYDDATFVDVILTYNSMTEIMPGAIKVNDTTFLKVDLSFNEELSYIHPGAFDLDVLKFTLVLHNNNIVSFSILSALRSITTGLFHFHLDLSNNFIEDMQVENDTDEFDDFGRVDVSLDNNNWNCDCNHKSIAFDNSPLRGLVLGLHLEPQCSTFLCSTPDILRNEPVLWLDPDDFVCPPSVDHLIDVTDVVINPGENITLVCPVTFADPPITHYEWTFSPLLSVAERRQFGEEFWDVRFTRQTRSNIIVVENVQREGVYKCEAVSPIDKLSVNFSVSFARLQSTVPSVEENNANFTSTLSNKSVTPLPYIFVTVLLVVLCIVTLFLKVAVVTMAVLTLKFFKNCHSEKAIGCKPDQDTTKEKTEDPNQHAVEYKEYRRRPDVDEEEYYLSSDGIYQTLG